LNVASENEQTYRVRLPADERGTLHVKENHAVLTPSNFGTLPLVNGSGHGGGIPQIVKQFVATATGKYRRRL
jgi:hypothetical protein